MRNVDQEKVNRIRSALSSCFGTLAYHRYLGDYLLTDGALTMAKECGAFWLLDVIVSHQLNKKVCQKDFQVWQLQFCEGESQPYAKVIGTDGNNKVLVSQDVDDTDFPLPEGMTLYLDENVILLPSEH
jgi:hypothetical protein